MLLPVAMAKRPKLIMWAIVWRVLTKAVECEVQFHAPIKWDKVIDGSAAEKEDEVTADLEEDKGGIGVQANCGCASDGQWWKRGGQSVSINYRSLVNDLRYPGPKVARAMVKFTSSTSPKMVI